MKKIAIILYTALTLLSIASCTDLKEEVLNEQDESETYPIPVMPAALLLLLTLTCVIYKAEAAFGSCWKV